MKAALIYCTILALNKLILVLFEHYLSVLCKLLKFVLTWRLSSQKVHLTVWQKSCFMPKHNLSLVFLSSSGLSLTEHTLFLLILKLVPEPNFNVILILTQTNTETSVVRFFNPSNTQNQTKHTHRHTHAKGLL